MSIPSRTRRAGVAAEDPGRFDRHRPRSLSARRRWVVAFGLAVVACAASGAAPDAPVLTLSAIIAAMGIGVVLRWSVESTADLPDEQLDERLIAERNAAYLVSYQLISTVLVVVAVGLDVAKDWVDIGRVTGALLPAIPPLALFAPSAVLAWRRAEV